MINFVLFYTIFYRLLLHMAHAMIELHDLNKNPIAVITLGEAKIKTGYMRIIQPIDLFKIYEIIMNFDNLVKNNTYNHQLYRLLNARNNLLYQTYLKLIPLQHRTKRWDNFGRIIKWIAGTPDADDLRIINDTMNNLIENNNQQIIFNEALNSRISQLNQVTTELLQLDLKSKQRHVIEINLLTILLNIDAVQHQIEVLEDAILLAKNGIPSSRILSMKDFFKLKTFLQRQHIHVSSYEDLLTKATAQIALNNTHVMYMLKVPQISTEVYEYEYVSPLIQNQSRIYVESNYYISNKSHIFEISDQCKEDLEYYLCDSEFIKPSNPCINNLIQLQHANCTYEKVYSSGIIKRINDATILLNNVNLTLKSNCNNNTQVLEGSYLIQFDQCDLYLDNHQFSNYFMEMSSKSFRPTTGLTALETHIIEKPTLEYLGNLTLKHRSLLQHVYLENNSVKWKLTMFGTISISTTVLFASIILIYIVLVRKSNRTKVEVNLSTSTEASAPEDIEMAPIPTKSPYPDISDKRFQELVNYLNTPTSARPI